MEILVSMPAFSAGIISFADRYPARNVRWSLSMACARKIRGAIPMSPATKRDPASGGGSLNPLPRGPKTNNRLPLVDLDRIAVPLPTIR